MWLAESRRRPTSTGGQPTVRSMFRILGVARELRPYHVAIILSSLAVAGAGLLTPFIVWRVRPIADDRVGSPLPPKVPLGTLVPPREGTWPP